MKDKRGFLYLKKHKTLFAFSFLFLIVTSIFLFSLIPAQKFNNLKYSNNDLTFELVSDLGYYSYLGINKTILKADLTSHNSVNEIKQVGIGYQLVMEYDIIAPVSDLGGIIGDISFTDEKISTQIEKEYYIAYKRELEGIKEICNKWGLSANETEICLEYGQENYTYYNWEPYTSKDIIKGNITLGLFVYNNEGDYLDGIWNFGGLKISKHASWNASFNNGLVAYYKLDEASGVVIDSLGISNLTNYDAIPNVTGKINTAYNFTDTHNANGTITGLPIGASARTICTWVYPQVASDDYFISYGNAIAGKLWTLVYLTGTQFYMSMNGAGNDITGNTTHAVNNWYFVCGTYNGTRTNLYVNGNLEGNKTHTIDTASTGFFIGTYITGVLGLWGKLDEIGIWNRSLSVNEIIYLYNNGNGMSYGEEELPPLKTDIENWADLYNIRYYPNETYTLLNNLNSGTGNYTEYNASSDWLPIGNSTNQFNGYFYGQNFTISDLRQETTIAGEGIFGNVTNASFYDINLDNISINYMTYSGSNNAYTGILAGVMTNSVIFNLTISNSDIYNMGSYSGLVAGLFHNGNGQNINVINSNINVDFIEGGSASFIGGLFGYVRSNSYLNDVNFIDGEICYFYPAWCNENIGGIAGKIYNSDLQYSSVINSYMEGNSNIGGLVGTNEDTSVYYSYVNDTIIYANSNNIGGLVGYNDNSNIQYSYVNNLAILGNDKVGGLVGSLIDYGGDSFGIIQYSYVKDSEIGGIDNIGGLVGLLDRDYRGASGAIMILLNSYSANNTISGEYEIGGAVGTIIWSDISETYCNGIYNIFSYSDDITGIDDIGGLVGYRYACSNPTIFYSYWDETLFPIDNGLGTGLTTNQSKSISSYLPNWNIVSVNSTNNSYPFLTWEIGSGSIWSIYQAEIEPNYPILESAIPNITMCPNNTATINLNNYFSNLDNDDYYLMELNLYDEDIGNYISVYLHGYFPLNTYSYQDNDSNDVLNFKILNGIFTIKGNNRIFDNPLSNIIYTLLISYNQDEYGTYNSDTANFTITLSESECFVPIPEPEIELTGWFGWIVDWFLGFFPDSDDLSASQKVGIIIVSMIFITALLLLVTYNSITGIPTAIVYLIGFINFMLVIFFIAIGYIPIIVVILLFLVIIALAWLRFRGGGGN